jgi:serine/threonine protein phosphatase PrpC
VCPAHPGHRMGDLSLEDPMAPGRREGCSECSFLPPSPSTPAQTHAGSDSVFSFVSSHVSSDQQWLRHHGELAVGSGCMRSEQYCLAMHTDFGPLDQDKTTNQDYALAWKQHAISMRDPPSLIIAIADGVTSSFLSELASALVCSVAVRTLAEHVDDESVTPQRRIENAVTAAASAVSATVAELGRNPSGTCPPGIYPITWRYMLQYGRLFQTTLTLAWFDGHWLRVGVVGDGGMLWWDDRVSRICVEAQCDLATQEVHALGPAVEQPVVLDRYVDREMTRPFTCALFTDGVGRGIGASHALLLDELSSPESESADNPAERFIQRAIAGGGVEFSDNLTLAVLRVVKCFNA